MPVTVGTHRNGARYARVTLIDRGITATVEGTGQDDDEATGDLRMRLMVLAAAAEESADAMKIDGDQ